MWPRATDYWTGFRSENNNKVLRGGAWTDGSGYARCAIRNYYHPDFRFDLNGFRCART